MPPITPIWLYAIIICESFFLRTIRRPRVCKTAALRQFEHAINAFLSILDASRRLLQSITSTERILIAYERTQLDHRNPYHNSVLHAAHRKADIAGADVVLRSDRAGLQRTRHSTHLEQRSEVRIRNSMSGVDGSKNKFSKQTNIFLNFQLL